MKILHLLNNITDNLIPFPWHLLSLEEWVVMSSYLFIYIRKKLMITIISATIILEYLPEGGVGPCWLSGSHTAAYRNPSPAGRPSAPPAALFLRVHWCPGAERVQRSPGRNRQVRRKEHSYK